MRYKINALLLKICAVLIPASIILGSALASSQPNADKTSHQLGNNSDDVSAIEDLMREHGLLSRVLLIYEKGLKDIDAGQEPSYSVLFKAATIIRDFVENYHEKLEEDHVFPRFEKTGKLAETVKVLRLQHQAGRMLTDVVLETSNPKNTAKTGPERLHKALRSFIAMYRPHKAREDTVLFPALHAIVSRDEYEEMGEVFEEKERRLFGPDGFEKNMNAVSALEKECNIFNLSAFTAKIEK